MGFFLDVNCVTSFRDIFSSCDERKTPNVSGGDYRCHPIGIQVEHMCLFSHVSLLWFDDSMLLWFSTHVDFTIFIIRCPVCCVR